MLLSLNREDEYMMNQYHLQTQLIMKQNGITLTFSDAATCDEWQSMRYTSSPRSNENPFSI